MMEIQEGEINQRRNSFQSICKERQKQTIIGSSNNSIGSINIVRSNSYDDIYDTQAQVSKDPIQQTLAIRQQTSFFSNEEGKQQYEGNQNIISLVNETQSTINKMNKISVLKESQKLLRKLHKELENLVLRHNPCKFESNHKMVSQYGKNNNYKEMKSRSRSRSKEKKRSIKYYNLRCYSPDQKMHKYQIKSNSYNNNNQKYKLINDSSSQKKSIDFYSRCRGNYSRQQRQSDNNRSISRSDSNSSQNNYDTNLDENEKSLNLQLERINFNNDYSPPSKTSRLGCDKEKVIINKKKILFFLNKLEERSEEEEEQDMSQINTYKATQQSLDKSTALDTNQFDSFSTKHEIDQLNEILKNLSIDLHNEVIKVQQQQDQNQSSAVEIEDNHVGLSNNNQGNNQNKQILPQISSDIVNKQNLSTEMTSESILAQSSFSSYLPSTLNSSINSASSCNQKYKFRQVEAGMDYVIRKIQNL